MKVEFSTWSDSVRVEVDGAYVGCMEKHKDGYMFCSDGLMVVGARELGLITHELKVLNEGKKNEV